MKEILAQLLSESIPDTIACRVLEMDGDRFTVREFIHTNMIDPDVQHIPLSEAIEVIGLSVGQVVNLSSGCGWNPVKRII